MASDPEDNAPAGLHGSPRRVRSPPEACHDFRSGNKSPLHHPQYPIDILRELRRNSNNSSPESATLDPRPRGDREEKRVQYLSKTCMTQCQSDSQDGERLRSHDPKHARAGVYHYSGSRYETVHTPIAQSPTETNLDLDYLINEAMVETAENSDVEFMPINELNRLISWENVERELEHEHILNKTLVASKICEGQPPLKRIFAILCMLKLARLIERFIDDGVTDRDLPFVFQGKQREPVYKKKRERASFEVTSSIRLFEDRLWTRSLRKEFSKVQWHFLAPYIPLSLRPGQESRHLTLQPSIIMPFVEDVTNVTDEIASRIRLGGTSQVRRIRIHPAHHNGGKNEVSLSELYNEHGGLKRATAVREALFCGQGHQEYLWSQGGASSFQVQ
ncbi:hypothetical protein N0V86_009643 [Didymella sp. IMI 355093]|nr:hypothetical protein N0V86_009643 [Didymella sp. IMI 355093]